MGCQRKFNSKQTSRFTLKMKAAKRQKLSASPKAELSAANYCVNQSFPTENAEQVEENRKQVSQYCLGLPTILRRILEHLTTSELKKASLVDKLWNFEARSVMKERGNVRANFWSFDQCQRLEAFSSDLETMRVVPFSGIRFLMSHNGRCQLISNGPQLHPSYQVILDRLPWKRFSVRFCDDWERCKDCPALVLVKRILEDYCGALEHLTLGFGQERFLRSILQDRSFPRLKSLSIESRAGGPPNDLLTSDFIKMLVSAAPNLQQLVTDGAIDLTVNVLKGSSAVIVPKLTLRPLLTPICEGLIGTIRANAMEIHTPTEEFDPGLLNSFLPKLLNASRTTLKSLTLDFLFAVPLMCYGICFENVTLLKINCFSLENIEPSILKLPTGLDFTRMFPKLIGITILDKTGQRASSDLISAFVEQANALCSRALPDRAVNIKRMCLNPCGSLEDFILPVLAQMLPDVQTVFHTRNQHQGCSFIHLREHFLGLELVVESRYPDAGMQQCNLERSRKCNIRRGLV